MHSKLDFSDVANDVKKKKKKKKKTAGEHVSATIIIWHTKAFITSKTAKHGYEMLES